MREAALIRTIGQLAERHPPVAPATQCRAVYEAFMFDPDLLCLAVVADDRVRGLVNRQDFVPRYTYRLGPDLYGDRPISHLMDSAPLIVEASSTPEALSTRLLGSSPSGLLRGFVIVDHGGYVGTGTALTLLRIALDVSKARSRELERQQRRAEEANRSKSNFLASMSHELRTPLNAIIGFADFMACEPFGPLDPPRYKEYVTDIHASATHLLSLIGELLDMAKVEAGRLSLDEAEFPARRPIEDAARMLRLGMRDAGIEFAERIAVDGRTILGDERMLRQVLLNILSNAQKFTPEGGRVVLNAAVSAAGLEITVEDTGIGIPEDRIDRVFEPFEQVESAMSRTRPGTGLGLPLAREMVRAHGGDIGLASRLGHGTRVTVCLPRARVGDIAAQASSAA